jgi:hypothetical protein
MGWQAQTGLHFNLAGGFAVVPDPDGRSAFVSGPTGAVAVLDRLSSDPESLQDTPLPSTDAQVAEVRAAIIAWHVGVTVVTQEGRQPAYSAAFLTAVYGRLPALRHGAWVWTGPPGSRTVTLAPTTLADCTPAAESGVLSLAAPTCVLRTTGGLPTSAIETARPTSP